MSVNKSGTVIAAQCNGIYHKPDCLFCVIAQMLKKAMRWIDLRGAALIGGMIATLLLPGGCQTTNSADRKVSAFDELVFGVTETGEGGLTEADPGIRLTRWRVPLRAHFAQPPPGPVAALGDAVLAELAAITGHDLAMAAPGERANVALVYGDAALLVRTLKAMGARIEGYEASSAAYGFCWSTHWHAAGEIRRAVVYIADADVMPDEKPGAVAACLRHEMGHVMGLRFHAERSYSVMAAQRSLRDYTATDRQVLRWLYHPGLPASGARDQVLARLRDLPLDP